MTEKEEYIDTRTGEATGSGVEFATVLLNLSDGASHQELTDRLRELVQAVQDACKPGTLTYTLKVTPMDVKGEVVALKDTIKLKKPDRERQEHLLFADDHGNLTQDPPNQPSIFDRLIESD